MMGALESSASERTRRSVAWISWWRGATVPSLFIAPRIGATSIEDSLPDAVKKASITHALRKGETLFSQGSPTLGVYEVLSGRVRLARTNQVGHYALLFVAQAGDPLAEASVFMPAFPQIPTRN